MRARPPPGTRPALKLRLHPDDPLSVERFRGSRFVQRAISKLAGKGRREAGVGTTDLLARLPLDYKIVGGLPTQHGPIDHVIVGPTGVLVIETNSSTGRVLAKDGRLTGNGFPLDADLRQARSKAIEVRRRLEASGIELWVDAVLVFPFARMAKARIDFPRVIALHGSLLLDFIQGRPQVLEPSVVSRAAQVIERSSSPSRH